jgi:hypothetical protein
VTGYLCSPATATLPAQRKDPGQRSGWLRERVSDGFDASEVAGAGFEMVKELQAPMGAIPATIGSAIVLLMSPALPMAQVAQQVQSMTATASAPSKSDACTASTGKAMNSGSVVAETEGFTTMI